MPTMPNEGKNAVWPRRPRRQPRGLVNWRELIPQLKPRSQVSDMAKFEHVKIQCPFCSWCKRTLQFPDHLLTAHVPEIHIRPITTDHCIYAYVAKNKEEITFCACLTCGRGAMGEGITGNSARWISMHSKNADCKKDHRKKLATLKDTIKAATVPSTVPQPAIAMSTITAQHIWDNIKKITPYVPFMLEIEESCKDQYYDEEEPFVFDAAEGFEVAIRTAVGERINNCNYPEEMNKQQSEYEVELAEMRREIQQLRQHVSCLQEDTQIKSQEMTSIHRRLSNLERENKQYKTAYPEFEPGDPQ
jgi:hypothetical protein